MGDDLARGRIIDLEGFSQPGRFPLPVDPQIARTIKESTCGVANRIFCENRCHRSPAKSERSGFEKIRESSNRCPHWDWKVIGIESHGHGD